MTSKTSLLGAAGEHFIMCELLRRGHIAALAPQGAPNTDIVVTDLSGDRLCSIQVKARSAIARGGGWHMHAKHEDLIGDRLFYCFVDFGKSLEDRPSVFVMQSKIVATVISASHRAWLSVPGKNGRQRNDSDKRQLLQDHSKAYHPEPTPYPQGWMDRYQNAWHLLGMGD
ncbi:hypothetical protein [Breoghania sp.]|uniref:hypothetical protein n=1 Tax=Breoghania sp. TaxID=2065378 RepID=UPI002AA682C7|nr:hypothetical protein [Breoghania sp.]